MQACPSRRVGGGGCCMAPSSSIQRSACTWTYSARRSTSLTSRGAQLSQSEPKRARPSSAAAASSATASSRRSSAIATPKSRCDRRQAPNTCNKRCASAVQSSSALTHCLLSPWLAPRTPTLLIVARRQSSVRHATAASAQATITLDGATAPSSHALNVARRSSTTVHGDHTHRAARCSGSASSSASAAASLSLLQS